MTKKAVKSAVAAVCAAALGAEASNGGPGWAMGEGISWGGRKIVSAEASVGFDSKFLSYGLVDNNEPILRPAASVTFGEWFTLGVESIFDVTRYGRKRDAEGEMLYGNRRFRYQELDPNVSVGNSFGPDDAEWMPTTVEFSFGYAYEYHPRPYAAGSDDTQFATFEIGLPDLWAEPLFAYERDLVRDGGTYVNLELGHAFEVCEGVEFRPSIGQGFGNAQRVKGYLQKANGEPLDRAGLMDTTVKGEFTWEVAPGVALSAYLAYSDYLFGSAMRGAARRYEGTGKWDRSWNFTAGASVSVSF